MKSKLPGWQAHTYLLVIGINENKEEKNPISRNKKSELSQMCGYDPNELIC